MVQPSVSLMVVVVCAVGILTEMESLSLLDAKVNHNLKEKMLPDCYEYSQTDIAEKMFLAVGTVASTEKRAIEKVKQKFADMGINVKDLLED